METEHEKKKKEGNNFLKSNYFMIAGAVILILIVWFGFKALISSFEDYRVTLVDAPKEVAAGGIATITWRIDGPPTTINRTTAYLGTVSNPGDFNKDTKSQDASYTDFVKDFADGKYDIPLQFVGNIKITAVGKYYFRLYALIKDKNYWSDEYTFEVKPADYKISLVNSPKQLGIDDISTFTWSIDGPPTTINSTAVYFGPVSFPGELGKDIRPQDTKYTDFVRDFAGGRYNIPLQFVGNMKIATAGAYFFRVHAFINGGHYWTDEYTFEAK
ncbi:hypothetical protein FJY90_04250 [Candidatus Gottesmanbacteria bacterium]|nr:hypothetical protein [Candidatus Gottesmanbacteria bacterium]